MKLTIKIEEKVLEYSPNYPEYVDSSVCACESCKHYTSQSGILQKLLILGVCVPFFWIIVAGMVIHGLSKHSNGPTGYDSFIQVLETRVYDDEDGKEDLEFSRNHFGNRYKFTNYLWYSLAGLLVMTMFAAEIFFLVVFRPKSSTELWR